MTKFTYRISFSPYVNLLQAKNYKDAWKKSGDAEVFGDVQVSGDTLVYGNAQVYGDGGELLWLKK